MSSDNDIAFSTKRNVSIFAKSGTSSFQKKENAKSFQGEPLVNKLMLLFLFDKMEIPLTDNTLIDICTDAQNNWLNYIDLIETRDSLLEDDFIANVSQNTCPIYSITPMGRACLADFYTSIPISKREEISSFAKNNQSRFREKQEYSSDYYKNKDGSYTVVLKTLEMQQTTLEIKLKVESKQLAKQIHLNWHKKAVSLYSGIIENLVD